jgi:predicted Zn-dependent peptidase
MIESQGLGRDYFNKLFAAMDKMNRTDCLEFARRTVHPDRLTIVVVGDAGQLKESLSEIAPVEVISAN